MRTCWSSVTAIRQVYQSPSDSKYAAELRRLLQLLAPIAGDSHKPAVQFGQRGHVAPQLLELRDGEDIFLALAPALLHVLQRNVGRHAGGQGADGRSHLIFAFRV